MLSIPGTRRSQSCRHSKIHHQEREDVVYSMAVTGCYKTPLDRQLMERVKIANFKRPLLMNEMGGLRVKRMQYRRWGGD